MTHTHIYIHIYIYGILFMCIYVRWCISSDFATSRLIFGRQPSKTRSISPATSHLLREVLWSPFFLLGYVLSFCSLSSLGMILVFSGFCPFWNASVVESCPQPLECVMVKLFLSCTSGCECFFMYIRDLFACQVQLQRRRRSKHLQLCCPQTLLCMVWSRLHRRRNYVFVWLVQFVGQKSVNWHVETFHIADYFYFFSGTGDFCSSLWQPKSFAAIASEKGLLGSSFLICCPRGAIWYHWAFLVAVNVVVVASFFKSWIGILVICSVTSQVSLTVLLPFACFVLPSNFGLFCL